MERRKIDLANLDAVLDEVRRLHDGGYEKVGQWDLAQVCRHVAMPMDQSIDGFTFKPPVMLPVIAKLFAMKRKFFKTRSIKPGLPAPPGFVPEPGGDPAEAMAELERAVGRLKGHTGPFANHPIFGPLSTDQWHQFHAIHSSHHLSFLVPVAKKGPVPF